MIKALYNLTIFVMRNFLKLPSCFILFALFSGVLLSNVLPKQKDDFIYVLDDENLLFDFLKRSIENVSSDIYEKTGFKFLVSVSRTTPSGIYTNIDNTVLNNELGYSDKFRLRREYENSFLSKMQDNYAVLFIFYNDHHITLKSNVGFLDTDFLLDEYAYPYLPTTNIYSHEYQEGVNTGVSNVYLATAHAISSHYNVILDIPKPMQRPGDGIRFVIYIMLFSLVGLFLLVYFGLFNKIKDKFAK